MNQDKSLKRIATALESAHQNATTRDTSHEPRTAKQIKKARRPLMYRLRLLMYSDRVSHAAMRARMSFPIMGLVGPNGGGKTLAGVLMCMQAMSEGRRVLSTCPLFDWRTGELHELYVPWTDWDQLLDWQDGDVFADEIISIAGSREGMSLDVRAQTLLVQLRKRNCRFWWTAPSYARADRIIREVTQAITECRGFYTDASAAQVRRGVIQSWSPKRLFAFRTYDSQEFDEWTSGKREKANVLVTQWFHGPGSTVFNSYDTLGAVNVLVGLNDGGVCLTCNGQVSKRRKPCRCEHPVLVMQDPERETTNVDAELARGEHQHELVGA